MFCSPVPRIPEQTESYNENNNKEYLASGGYPQTQVIIDGKLGQATGRGTGGSVTIIVRSYVRTYVQCRTEMRDIFRLQDPANVS